jgi:hypothetical protein
VIFLTDLLVGVALIGFADYGCSIALFPVGYSVMAIPAEITIIICSIIEWFEFHFLLKTLFALSPAIFYSPNRWIQFY